MVCDASRALPVGFSRTSASPGWLDSPESGGTSMHIEVLSGMVLLALWNSEPLWQRAEPQVTGEAPVLLETAV